MHHHFQQRDSGYSDVLEVVWVFSPRLFVLDSFLFGGIVAVESITVGVDELNGILKFYNFIQI